MASGQGHMVTTERCPGNHMSMGKQLAVRWGCVCVRAGVGNGMSGEIVL